MATKKQKHAAALAKREKLIASEKSRGLEALEWDREKRRLESEKVREQGKQINARFNTILSGATPAQVSAAQKAVYGTLSQESAEGPVKKAIRGMRPQYSITDELSKESAKLIELAERPITPRTEAQIHFDKIAAADIDRWNYDAEKRNI